MNTQPALAVVTDGDRRAAGEGEIDLLAVGVVAELDVPGRPGGENVFPLPGFLLGGARRTGHRDKRRRKNHEGERRLHWVTLLRPSAGVDGAADSCTTCGGSSLSSLLHDSQKHY